MLTNGVVVDRTRLPEDALEARPVSVPEASLVQAFQHSSETLQHTPVMLSEVNTAGEPHALQSMNTPGQHPGTTYL